MRELGLVDAGELLPLARGAVERLEDLADFELLDAGREERLERLERRRVLGRGADDLAVGGDRLVEVVEARLVDLAEAVLELEDLVRRLADLGFAREDLRELAPALGLREEPIERADRGLVLGVDLEHAAVARDGALDVLELRLEDLREAEAELDEAVGVLGELVELRVVELRRPPASG